MNYDKLLDKAYKEVKIIEHTDRFDIPSIKSYPQGKTTLVSNLSQLASYLRRDQNHIIKFLLKELATSGKQRDNKLILQRRIPSKKINKKIQQYAKDFVLCKECGKPDTEIIKEKDRKILHCLACGAKHPITTKI